MPVFIVCLNDYPHSAFLSEHAAKSACARLMASDGGPMRFYHYKEVPMVLDTDKITKIIRRNLFDDDEEYTDVCRQCAVDILSGGE